MRSEETMNLQRLAMISVHASPVAPMGGSKTGGMNVYIHELAQELGRRGIQVDVFTRRTDPAEPKFDLSIGAGVRVIAVEAGPAVPLAPDAIHPYLQSFTSRVIAFTVRHNLRYDMVYSHYWLSGLVALQLHESWRMPFLHMFHTLGIMKRHVTGGAQPHLETRIAEERRIAQNATTIVAATADEQRQLVRDYQAPSERIAVVPPGVNTARFFPWETANPFDPADERHLILYVGRIEPLKSVDTLIRALAILRDEHPAIADEWVCAIVGGDPDNVHDEEMQRLRRLVREANLTEHVRFKGAIAPAKLAPVYRAASVLVLPSDYESFGMVALEAMACGTPVVASRVGGLVHLVRDGETGFLVEPRNPAEFASRLYAMVTQPEMRAGMGQRSALIALRYSWGDVADQVLQVAGRVATPRRLPVASHRTQRQY
jgi:D-inositol-3-phosphate glycosyltransferase